MLVSRPSCMNVPLTLHACGATTQLYERTVNARALAIELCQIVHRAGLTQDSVGALLLAADVLRLLLAAARRDLQRLMCDKIRGAPRPTAKLFTSDYFILQQSTRQ